VTGLRTEREGSNSTNGEIEGFSAFLSSYEDSSADCESNACEFHDGQFFEILGD
jgi:hypothetical protein